MRQKYNYLAMENREDHSNKEDDYGFTPRISPSL